MAIDTWINLMVGGGTPAQAKHGDLGGVQNNPGADVTFNYDRSKLNSLNVADGILQYIRMRLVASGLK